MFTNPQTDLVYTDANNPPAPSQLDRLPLDNIEHICRYGSKIQQDACLDWAYSNVSSMMHERWCDIANQSYRYDEECSGDVVNYPVFLIGEYYYLSTLSTKNLKSARCVKRTDKNVWFKDGYGNTMMFRIKVNLEVHNGEMAKHGTSLFTNTSAKTDDLYGC